MQTPVQPSWVPQCIQKANFRASTCKADWCHMLHEGHIMVMYRHIEAHEESVQQGLHKLHKQAPTLLFAVQFIDTVIVKVVCLSSS